MAGMARVTRRRARKSHRCGSHDCNTIRPGDIYLEHVVSPDYDDLGNTHWWRLPECAECAERYGRGHLLAAADRGEETP